MSRYTPREHGGNVAAAARRYGVDDMVDLSTGISPVYYPSSPIDAAEWQALPTDDALQTCLEAARHHYNVPEALALAAGPGTQALLQTIPLLLEPGTVWINQPTYNEHAPAWQQAGHDICGNPHMLAHARHAVVVAPNNPTGAGDPGAIAKYAAEIQQRDGCLLIDGAFADGAFGEDLLAALKDNPSVVHLRSFGKFFGMAGLRLGFAIGHTDLIAKLVNRVGPWATNTAALRIGSEAMLDKRWVRDHHLWLVDSAERLAILIESQRFKILGGTCLFQTIEDDQARALHEHLAQNGIWTRIYSDFPRLVRFGLPGPESDWERLETALRSFQKVA